MSKAKTKYCDFLNLPKTCKIVGWNMESTEAPCCGNYEECPIHKMHIQNEMMKPPKHEPLKDVPIINSNEELRAFLEANAEKLKSKSHVLSVNIKGELHFARIDDGKITLYKNV